MQISLKLKTKFLFIVIVIVLLSGCPIHKSSIEEKRNRAQKDAIETSFNLLQMIKDKNYKGIERIHVGGTLSDFKIYQSPAHFKKEVDFISSKLQNSEINKNKIKVIDNNGEKTDRVSELTCLYPAFKTDSDELSITVVFIDQAGPKEVALFERDYTNLKVTFDDLPDHSNVIDSLWKIQDSLNKIKGK